MTVKKSRLLKLDCGLANGQTKILISQIKFFKNFVSNIFSCMHMKNENLLLLVTTVGLIRSIFYVGGFKYDFVNDSFDYSFHSVYQK